MISATSATASGKNMQISMAFAQKELVCFKKKYASLINVTKTHEAAAFPFDECCPIDPNMMHWLFQNLRKFFGLLVQSVHLTLWKSFIISGDQIG